MRRHLIIGQAPGPGRDLTRRVLDCPSGSRLAALAGTTLSEVLRRCDTVNAYRTGDETRAQARARVALLVDHDQFDTIMLVGAETCRLANVAPPFRDDEIHVYGLNHTSGLSRWWNHPQNKIVGAEIAVAWWAAVTS